MAVRPDAKIAEAAVATLGRWTDATDLPAMATVAEQAAISSFRHTARGSTIRHFDRNRETWTPATTAIVAPLLAVAKEAAPRQKLLAVLARARTQRRAMGDLRAVHGPIAAFGPSPQERFNWS